MPQRKRLVVFVCIGIPLLALALLLSLASGSPDASVSGVVVSASGPIAGAHVRVRATENLTYTAADGSFSLLGLVEGEEVEVAAWADGYYIANAHITPTIAGITLTLRPYHTVDHTDYEWSSPSTCDSCHPMLTPQWTGNAHGNAVSNPRFFSLYNGTDITGTVVISPGYQLDFPGTSGNCANCHAPGAAANAPFTTDMNDSRDNVAAGIHCDFCHKVGGVYIDPASGLPYANAPGVLSLRLLRPPSGEQIFFGPYDDIKDPDTYLPEMRQSVYCAPCHQFSFWGTPIYQSFREWQESPYPAMGVECQTCHQPPNGDHYFALPDAGGLWHPAENIPSHNDLGLKDTAFITGTVAMSVTTRTVGNRVTVTVTLTNTGAGHHVPTDHPGRHLILTISAVDGSSLPLPQTGGDTVPDWGGAQAGMPGKVFAKVLEDALTREYPVVSYWKQSFILSDNRIPALSSDISVYQFTAPLGGGEITISAVLLFRRNLQAELDTRGWDSPDILMQEARIEGHVQAYFQTFLPTLTAGSASSP